MWPTLVDIRCCMNLFHWSIHVPRLSLLIIHVADHCKEPLGMEDNITANDQITASSEWSCPSNSYYHGVNNSRLNRPSQSATTGAWSALTNDLNQWIQVNLMVPTWVTGIKIQGREDSNQWVTKYKVEYSSNGQNWTYVQSKGDHEGKVSQTQNTSNKHDLTTDLNCYLWNCRGESFTFNEKITIQAFKKILIIFSWIFQMLL